MIVSFFGYGFYTSKDEDEKQLLRLLEEKIGDKPCDFYLGDYGGFDYFSKHCCKMYQQTHKNCKLILILAYYNNNQSTKDRLKGYDESIYPPLETVPYRLAILRRNDWIVEHSDLIIFNVKHSIGGARKAYEYAVRKKKEFICL